MIRHIYDVNLSDVQISTKQDETTSDSESNSWNDRPTRNSNNIIPIGLFRDIETFQWNTTNQDGDNNSSKPTTHHRMNHIVDSKDEHLNSERLKQDDKMIDNLTWDLSKPRGEGNVHKVRWGNIHYPYGYYATWVVGVVVLIFIIGIGCVMHFGSNPKIRAREIGITP